MLVVTLTGLMLTEVLTGEKHQHLPHQDFHTTPTQSTSIVGTASIYQGSI